MVAAKKKLKTRKSVIKINPRKLIRYRLECSLFCTCEDPVEAAKAFKRQIKKMGGSVNGRMGVHFQNIPFMLRYQVHIKRDNTMGTVVENPLSDKERNTVFKAVMTKAQYAQHQKHRAATLKRYGKTIPAKNLFKKKAKNKKR